VLADVLVVAHAAASLFLAGLSWTVAVVVYPGFAEAGRGPQWGAFHAAHSRRITWVVGPPWAVEGLTVAGLLVTRPDGVPLWLVLLAGAAGAATVALTVLSAVPLHERLGPGFDHRLHRRLQRSHAWRTLAWSVAASAGLGMLVVPGS
jgi:hypothetical protein